VTTLLETVEIRRDDFDGSPEAETHHLRLDGKEVEIDLSDVNFDALCDVLNEFFAKGRKPVRTKKSNGTPYEDRGMNAKIRAWGKTQPEWADKLGSGRGSLPRGLRGAYNRAHWKQ
jgi:hypothetical protein